MLHRTLIREIELKLVSFCLKRTELNRNCVNIFSFEDWQTTIWYLVKQCGFLIFSGYIGNGDFTLVDMIDDKEFLKSGFDP